jgi:hypothetical protein
VGLDNQSAIPPSQLPEPFRQILHYMCDLLEIQAPPVLCHPVLRGSARVALLQTPTLLCGSTLLAESDSVELGFRLGRALALATTGRMAGSVRSGGQLRPYVMAALAIARGSLRVQEPALEGARNAIAALDAPARARITEVSRRLAGKYEAINLTAWGKGLGRMASRLSLVICGDLLRVGQAVAEEEGQAALDDLLAFALSFDHLDFRQEIHERKSP